MHQRAHLVLLGLAVWLAPPTSAFGQPASNTKPGTAETMDVRDVLAWVRHRPPPAPPSEAEARKPSFVFSPSVQHDPVTGLSIGGGGSLTVTLGDPTTTHMSTVAGGASISLKGYVFAIGDVQLFTSEDAWYIEGVNAFEITAENTYGVGPHTTPEDAVNTKYHFLRLYETVYRRVLPGLFAGGGVSISAHTNVEAGKTHAGTWETSPYVTYTLKQGFPLDGQRSNGATVSLRFDNRDSTINPDRGWYGEATYRAFFEGFLGGTSTWQELILDARAYPKLSRGGRSKLAMRAYAELVTGGVAPYFDLPATAMDSTWRSGRGYTEGRFRGERLLYGELEYRATLTHNGLIGLVAFLNATTVADSQSGEQLFDRVSPAVGVGFRLLLNKQSKTNLCVDVGIGRGGSHGVFLAVEEAF